MPVARSYAVRHAPLRLHADMEAYDVFAQAATTNALKVVLSAQPVEADGPTVAMPAEAVVS